MGKVCRNIRAQWNAEALSNAVKAVQRGLSQSVISLSAYAPSEPTQRTQIQPDADGIESIDSEDSSEDELPLANKKRVEDNPMDITFHELMETPDLVRQKQETPRRKSLNYKAQVVKKSLFDDRAFQKSTEKDTQSAAKVKAAAVKVIEDCQKASCSKITASDSWYCLLCQEASQKDMRQCIGCQTWAHDECLGYSASDDDEYTCRTCEK